MPRPSIKTRELAGLQRRKYARHVQRRLGLRPAPRLGVDLVVGLDDAFENTPCGAVVRRRARRLLDDSPEPTPEPSPEPAFRTGPDLGQAHTGTDAPAAKAARDPAIGTFAPAPRLEYAQTAVATLYFRFKATVCWANKQSPRGDTDVPAAAPEAARTAFLRRLADFDGTLDRVRR